MELKINPKHEIPAFAEAASRRQAKFETISNDQNSKLGSEVPRSRAAGHLIL
jgi:hypothetical protein